MAIGQPSQRPLPPAGQRRDSHAHEGQHIMANMMPYQYPPPLPHQAQPQPGVSDGDLPPAYMGAYPPPPAAPSRESKKKPAPSFTSPQYNARLNGQQKPVAPTGEKKRNKLNYCRTSKACKYCRHRKIRCLTTSHEAQGGKCNNCVRLKKECIKQPVDHENEATPASRKPSSRSAPRGQLSSGSQSPVMPPGPAADTSNNPAFLRLNMPATQSMTSLPIQSPGGTPTTTDPRAPQVAHSGRPYDYAPSLPTEPLSTSWRPYSQESPVTPSFPAYHAAPPPSWNQHPVGHNGWGTYPQHPPQIATRSLSYSEHPSSTYQPLSQAITSPPSSYDRRSSISSDVYPSQLSPMEQHMQVSSSMDSQAAPLSAGAVPPAHYGTWHPQSYSHYARHDDGAYAHWAGHNDHPHHHHEPPLPPAAATDSHSREPQTHASHMYYTSR